MVLQVNRVNPLDRVVAELFELSLGDFIFLLIGLIFSRSLLSEIAFETSRREADTLLPRGLYRRRQTPAQDTLFLMSRTVCASNWRLGPFDRDDLLVF